MNSCILCVSISFLRKENLSQMILAMKPKKSVGRNETAANKYALCLFGSVLRTWEDLTTHEGHDGILRNLFFWALSQTTLTLPNLERWLKSIGVLSSNYDLNLHNLP